MERWAPFKELWLSVQGIILQRNGSFHHLKSLIRRHKPDFLNLLKNPVKNSEHRDKVRKADTNVPVLKGNNSSQILSQDFIDEVLIISDLFDLNEFSALELLIEGERQKPHYPQLARGLVAVLLYWDGRKCLTSSLKTLIQCRRGEAWTMDVSDEMIDFATNLTSELLENGMTKQILSMIESINVEKEMELLSKQRGLGGPEHQKQVKDLISGVQQDLAECLFNFAAQSHLPLRDSMLITNHLEKNTVAAVDGKLSLVSATLLHAVFYALTLPQSTQTHQDNDGSDLLKQPLLAEKDFISTVHRKLTKREDWIVPGVKACMQLAWALTLRSLAQIPVTIMECMPETFGSSSFTEALEQDEMILEQALAGKVFQFLKDNVLSCPGFYQEEFFIRRIHGLVTDFIVSMPLKLKEIRNHGDEVARIVLLHVTQHEEPPSLREDFKHLMELITVLYEEDDNDLQLSVQYWCPASENFQGAQSSAYMGSSRLYQRFSQRQVSLFKFLRQSGDFLPPLLYIPYLRMLAALSTGRHSARMAFDMLRANGVNSGVVSEGTSVSWDHFFASIHRYYSNLRQDQSFSDQSGHFGPAHSVANAQSTSMANHHHQMSITPQEVEGLRAVLLLLTKIMQYDDGACLAVYEHPNWNACNCLIGLLRCHIPTVLKGDIFSALNQLARIPGISVSLLQDFENTILLGSRSGAALEKTPLEIEFEDVEAREEEYHMTSSFLKLSTTLIDARNLVNMASSVQYTGFEPYLRFAIEIVFLKFMSRSYKRPEEKYEVATNVLKIFNKVLNQYSPNPEHFFVEKRSVEVGLASLTASMDNVGCSTNSMLGGCTFPWHHAQQNQTPNSKPPGFQLMIQIMSDGEFFRTVMEIVEDCICYLDRYTIHHALDKSLVEAGVTALQLIQIVLNHQDAFLACMRESGSMVFANTIDKLLLSVNPRTTKADYILSIAKFICHNATRPKLSLCASEIISCLCHTSNTTQREVYSMLTSLPDEKTRQRILHGFVEVIESRHLEVDEDASYEYDDVALLNSKSRLTVLKLLLHCVELPAPNLSHFLLGFNLVRPINKSSLQDAGVMESPRTCLHSVLSSLSIESTKNSPSTQPFAVTESPALAELCYQLIYKLSANTDTSGPVLRYLRSSHDFVYRHLQHLPFKPGGIAKESQLLLQQAWLLKTAAIELFSTASNKQRSHTQRLAQMLFEKPLPTSGSVLGASTIQSNTTCTLGVPNYAMSTIGSSFAMDSTMAAAAMATMNMTAITKNIESGQKLPQMLKLMEELDFVQEFPDPLILDEFVPANVESAIQSCEKTSGNGLIYCDLKALDELLHSNVNALHATDDAERKARAKRDVQNIRKTAIERNQARQSMHAKLALLNAWRHTLEVFLNACPSDLVTKDLKIQILLDVLQELLCRVLHPDAVAELTAPVAPICLTLVAHLRSCFAVPGFGNDQMRVVSVSDLNASASMNLSSISFGGVTAAIPVGIAGPLQVIIKNIIEWLIHAGVGPKIRSNLYASLLHYFQMCQKRKEPSAEDCGALSLAGLQAPSADIYTKLSRENHKLLHTYGNILVELVCKDACNGESVCKILAYSVLDAIVQIDWENAWLQFMIKKGYIGAIASSFVDEDEALQEVLMANSDTVELLYIYEQKMAFFCSLARTETGARAILDVGILAKLSQCSFLEMRPSVQDFSYDSFIPSKVARYRQLLFPALKLCLSILATLGGSHFEASVLVLEFMLAHVNSVVNPVLKLRPIPEDIQSLMELQLVTGIISQVACLNFTNEVLFSTIPQQVLIELQGHQSKIQHQIIRLLPQYCLFEQWKCNVTVFGQALNGTDKTLEMNLLVHEICGNLLSYCVTIMHQKSQDLDVPILLFAPLMAKGPEILLKQDKLCVAQEPNIGLLVQLLKTIASKFISLVDLLSLQKRKIKNIGTLTTQELKEIAGSNNEQISIPQWQALAIINLQKSVWFQEKLISSLRLITETSLLLLWRHLESYVVQPMSAASSSEAILFHTGNISNLENPMRRLQGTAVMSKLSTNCNSVVLQKSLVAVVNREVSDELMRVLPTCLTDAFLQRLCDIESQWSKSRNCMFVRPLVRRIQRIVQLHSPL